MTRIRLAAALGLAGAGLLLTGCASAIAGTGSLGTPGVRPSVGSSPKTSAGGTLTVATLGPAMATAGRSITSAHLSMNVSADGVNVTGGGDEEVANGKLVALDLSESFGSSIQLRIRIVDGQTYLQLPAALNPSGKPWLQASATSSNPLLQQLASSLSQVENSAALGSYTDFARAATDVTVVGHQSVGGVASTEYSVSVDLTKLPADLPGLSQLNQAGLTTLPFDIWLDGQNRPVKITEQLTVEGQTVQTTVSISKYDAPVSITAPPADQVATN